MRLKSLSITVCLALLGGCSAAQQQERASAESAAPSAASEAPVAPDNGDGAQRTASRRVDPRDRGLEVTLGEWAITPESDTIRPGPVVFVIRNRGTVPHGFEIELEGDSSGPGSGDLFKAESRLLQPGESTRMSFDLGPAVYKIECLVDGHDDMGMEDMLTVRHGAPLVAERPRQAPGRVSISDFEFRPSALEVPRGTKVTWVNDDPTDHTVTSTTGEFGSEAFGSGGSFSHSFSEPGTYSYRCAIHPDMKGTVKVE